MVRDRERPSWASAFGIAIFLQRGHFGQTLNLEAKQDGAISCSPAQC